MQKTVKAMILFIFSGVCISASAQEQQDVERIIIVTPADCLLLEQHIPDEDVNYKPDVDVRGNAVVPAEIENTNALRIGEHGYSFYLTHDALKENEFIKQYGLDTAQEGKIILGQVTVKDGDVLWNGVSLKNSHMRSIQMLCHDDRARKKRPMIKR